MCGICGIVGLGNHDNLFKMMEPLTHRGPDSQGVWSNSKDVYFGHKRLSIIDLEHGKQPMSSQCGKVVITYNGEIYNSNMLRNELQSKGYEFKTNNSDTEVIINGYLAWGEHVVNKLNGMWAFAIFDSKNQKIFLSRDRFGEKPLFYYHIKKQLLFASELSSFENLSSFDRQTSKIALAKYMAHGYIPAPHSILKGVNKLPAGTNLSFNISKNQIRLEKYWEFILEPHALGLRSEAEYAEELFHLLAESVNKRLVSDVPLGTFLSGGIDSTTITKIARNSLSNLRTFNIGFEDPSFDESVFAKESSNYIGTDHYSQQCTDHNMLEACKTLATKLDEPISDSSIIGTYQLCKFASKTVKVALGGDGADELFAGYDPFKALKTAFFFEKIGGEKISPFLLKFANSFIPVTHKNISLDFRIKRFLKGMTKPWPCRNPSWLSPFTITQINEALGSNFSNEEIYSESIQLWNKYPNDSIVDKTLNFYTNIYLKNGILTKIDRSSMLNSLEVRSPFLDINFVNFVRKIPHGLKFKSGISKYILKKSVSHILPSSIFLRKKKGFGSPIGNWIKNDKLKIKPNFNISNKLLSEHKQNKADHRLSIFADHMLRGKIISSLNVK